MASNKYYKIINKETGEDLEVCGEAGFHHAFFSYDRDEAERTFDICGCSEDEWEIVECDFYAR